MGYSSYSNLPDPGFFYAFKYEFYAKANSDDIDRYVIPFYGFNLNNLNLNTQSRVTSISNAYLTFNTQQFMHVLGGSDTADAHIDVFLKTLTGLTESTFEISDYYKIIGISSFQVPVDRFFKDSVDVTDLLTDHIVTNNENFKGFTFDVRSNKVNSESQDYWINFMQGVGQDSYYTWLSNYAPKLHIKGQYLVTDTVKYYGFEQGTISYKYDDKNNKVSSFNKRYKVNSTDNYYSRIDNYFDGMYRPIKKKVWTSPTSYDSTVLNYNYLNQKANTYDGKNNRTKFSYDKYNSLSETRNADTSSTTITTSYQSGLSYTFGTVPGLIQKQEYFDENFHKMEKYSDAVGNLRREIRFIDDVEDPTPEDNPGDIELVTDYKYDSLYRVTEVKTPENKRIYYSYDGLGRQIQRQTPDAGIVKYKYDLAGNLRFSQDDNQYHSPAETPPSKKITFRRYDDMNRLLAIGESINEGYQPSWSSLKPDSTVAFEKYDIVPENFLTINVYDTLSTAIAGIFSPPADYYNIQVRTKGNLVATAYRTWSSDSWSFKYYRYDARGRVVRMWNVINGLGTKVTDYLYNSMNQVVIFTYQSGGNDQKITMYEYDDAGRLKDVSIPPGAEIPEENDNPPSGSLNFASYKYNPNSQIDSLKLNNKTNKVGYGYNNRNWVTFAHNNIDVMGYTITYLNNGNISTLGIAGSYNNNFSNTDNFSMNYSYDKANRLLHSTNSSGAFGHTLNDTYDKDGNILTLNRSFTDGATDGFTYSYTANTNKLKKVSGSIDQYTYDYNGNMLTDELNKNYDAVYDYRNLLIYISSVRVEAGGGRNTYIFVTRYYYDEAGNRVRKIVFKRSSEIEPTGDPTWDNPEGDANGWGLVTDEFYSRDAAGKEIALYAGTTLSFWNIYGADNVGRINADTTRQFYLKDHLGSIRAVTDGSNTVIAAYDYDAWGYLLREWKSGDDAKYKFTTKERDSETSYDYFGARYYDSRIGRWGQTEPMYDKFIKSSPYNYSLNNPLIMKDIDGLEPVKKQAGTAADWKNTMNNSPNKIGLTQRGDAENTLLRMGEMETNGLKIGPKNTSKLNDKIGRYVYTEKGGWIDMVHFLFYAGQTRENMKNGAENPVSDALKMGYLQEGADPGHSSYSYEDLPSDKYGSEFAYYYFSTGTDYSLGEQIEQYLIDVLGATSPENAPNYNTMPEEDSKNPPTRTNKTTNPVYTKDNP